MQQCGASLFATIFGITDRSLPVLAVGLILFVLFFQIERGTAAPLVAIDMLKRSSVRWGNLAALTIFSMEAALVFLMTLYLQDVLHLGPVTTGLIFGVPGLSSVAAGVVAGRIIERRGAHTVLLAAMLVQGGLTVSASWIPDSRSARIAITAPRTGMPTVTATRWLVVTRPEASPLCVSGTSEVAVTVAATTAVIFGGIPKSGRARVRSIWLGALALALGLPWLMVSHLGRGSQPERVRLSAKQDLFTIDPRPFETALARARAALPARRVTWRSPQRTSEGPRAFMARPPYPRATSTI